MFVGEGDSWSSWGKEEEVSGADQELMLDNQGKDGPKRGGGSKVRCERDLEITWASLHLGSLSWGP